MATQPTHPTRGTETALAPAPATVEQNRSILERWQARRAEHKQARLTSAHNRRILAKWLRRTANRTPHPRPRTRTPEPLLHYRVSAVRTDLLEIAATLEHAQTPDPARVTALHDLLANGCDSPLYNADIHISELYATLDYVRSGL
jgi:hypothetical protein